MIPCIETVGRCVIGQLTRPHAEGFSFDEKSALAGVFGDLDRSMSPPCLGIRAEGTSQEQGERPGAGCAEHRSETYELIEFSSTAARLTRAPAGRLYL